MRCFVVEENTPFDRLSSTYKTDWPVPSQFAADEVLVDVYATSLNLFDGLQAEGKHQRKRPHPFIVGTEFAGVINPKSPIPAGCNFIPGTTRVFGAADGSYAETVKAKVSQLIEVPHGMSLDLASTLYVSWPTSYAALRYRANVQPGEWVLVHAAAGGVGLAAVQLAKAMGARVIAAAGSKEKMHVCTSLGAADYAINYRDPDWTKEVKRITGGRGVDVVYDPVGMVVPSMKVIAWNGRIVVIGFAGGLIEKVPANLVLLKNCSVTGLRWGGYEENEPTTYKETWDTLLQWFQQNKIVPAHFSHVYEGLEQAPTALSDLFSRKTWGKVVVRVRHELRDAIGQAQVGQTPYHQLGTVVAAHL